ncbi:MAG: His/Gly/Thr/Pro-type tRNA ligase C-terminal domain-containing protein [Proteobacteria bacterium]|nr:His/Gly/Thr/Pro-type tRNA ligase C-terminal domain-containing protein [Pseudomonadota bacterium]
MSKAPQTAITPTRAEDYPEWYQQVIKAADLSENSAVRGCMVIKPWGYAIWENIQKVLDRRFKETGHENAYFPLFIPLSYLEKEAEHVDGFAKECAVVTHHRLEAGPDGGLIPAGKLDEPLVIRPTSEMIIGATYAKWVQSYRDLPILINQWANVVRWEMRTRMFLRTTEFLWQEGHTVHATAAEAVDETLKMLDVYETFARDYMAMPVIKGEKASHERFPGAVDTYTIEAMMQDRKALQAGTSHFLGQNFAKAMEIHFQNEKGEDRLAPKHVVIMPIFRNEDERIKVLAYCKSLQTEIAATLYDDEKVRVILDDRDIRGGEKAWGYIKKGVPIRIEVGPRDMDQGAVFVAQRNKAHKDKKSMPRAEFLEKLPEILKSIQDDLYAKALAYRQAHTHSINSLQELKDYFATDKSEEKPEIHGGFALVHVADDARVGQSLKEMKLSHRCIPLEAADEAGTCIFTGVSVSRRSIIAKSY